MIKGAGDVIKIHESIGVARSFEKKFEFKFREQFLLKS